TLVMPQATSGSCLEREHVIGRGDKHDAADDYRRGFETLGVTRMEDPRCVKLRHVGGSDLTQTAIASPGVIAVVRSPVRAHGHRQQIFCAYIDHTGRVRLLRPQMQPRAYAGQRKQNECCTTQSHSQWLSPPIRIS